MAFLDALAIVPLLVRFAIGWGLLDMPTALNSHEAPTPRLGGLAVIAGVWAAAPFVNEGFLIMLVAATFAGPWSCSTMCSILWPGRFYKLWVWSLQVFADR